MRVKSKDELENPLEICGVEIRIADQLGDTELAPSLVENLNAAYELRKAIRGAERRLRPTDDEKEFAYGMAAGNNTLDDLPASMDADTVSALADYYWAEKGFSDKLLRQQGRNIRALLDERMERLLKGVEETGRPRAALSIIISFPQPFYAWWYAIDCFRYFI